MAINLNRVLIVDSEPLILRVYAAQLSRLFEVDTAPGGDEALDLLRNNGPYAVIVSDINLPDMDGGQLLTTVKSEYPEVVRIMLTANSRQEVVAKAINDAGIFRFLNKPCTSERLAKTIDLAIEGHHRMLIERQFLKGAVNAAIQIQLDVLDLLNPEALEKSRRVEKIVRFLVDYFSPPNGWMLNLAARLSMVGEAVPVEKARGMSAPEIGARLLGRLTQLSDIAELVRTQRDESRPEQEECGGQRLLRLALRFDDLIEEGCDPIVVVATLSENQVAGDEKILDALAQYVQQEYGTLPGRNARNSQLVSV